MLKLLWQKASEEAAEKEQADEHIQRALGAGRRVQDASLGQQRFFPIRDHHFFGTQLLWILFEQRINSDTRRG